MEYLPLEKILSNPDQPRKNFEKSALDGLAQSIRENGILQPILVEQISDDSYILCDGERRVRAARMAGLTEIPALIISSKENDGSISRLLKALVANLQRSDLNPLEEAQTYKCLMDAENLSVRALSIKTGIYETRIYNLLMILQLDQPIQKLIEAGKFTHNPAIIKLLLDIPDNSSRIDLCQKLTSRGLGKNGKAIRNSSNLLIKKLKNIEQFAPEIIPSIELAKTDARIDLPKWDILFQTGKIPSWSVIYKSALEACNACPRRPVASEIICKNCLAVILLSQIIKNGNQERAHILAKKVIKQRAMVNGCG